MFRAEAVAFLTKKHEIHPLLVFGQIVLAQIVTFSDTHQYLVYACLLITIYSRINYFWYAGLLLALTPDKGIPAVINLLMGVLTCSNRTTTLLFICLLPDIMNVYWGSSLPINIIAYFYFAEYIYRNIPFE